MNQVNVNVLKGYFLGVRRGGERDVAQGSGPISSERKKRDSPRPQRTSALSGPRSKNSVSEQKYMVLEVGK